MVDLTTLLLFLGVLKQGQGGGGFAPAPQPLPPPGPPPGGMPPMPVTTQAPVFHQAPTNVTQPSQGGGFPSAPSAFTPGAFSFAPAPAAPPFGLPPPAQIQVAPGLFTGRAPAPWMNQPAPAQLLPIRMAGEDYYIWDQQVYGRHPRRRYRRR